MINIQPSFFIITIATILVNIHYFNCNYNILLFFITTLINIQPILTVTIINIQFYYM